MQEATIKDAPQFLNANDQAMWVRGYNEAVLKMQCKGCDVPKDGVYQISESMPIDQRALMLSVTASEPFKSQLKECAARIAELEAQLAAVQQGVPDTEPAAWVATFRPEGLLALHSVVGSNLEELKLSVPSDSVFRPLYTHPTQQGE